MIMTRQFVLKVALPLLFTLGVHAEVKRFEIGQVYQLKGGRELRPKDWWCELKKDDYFVCSRLMEKENDIEVLIGPKKNTGDKLPRRKEHEIPANRLKDIVDVPEPAGKVPDWCFVAMNMVRASRSSQKFFVRQRVKINGWTKLGNQTGAEITGVYKDSVKIKYNIKTQIMGAGHQDVPSSVISDDGIYDKIQILHQEFYIDERVRVLKTKELGIIIGIALDRESKVMCSECKGTRSINGKKCITCGGTGKVNAVKYNVKLDDNDHPQWFKKDQLECIGFGRVKDETTGTEGTVVKVRLFGKTVLCTVKLDSDPKHPDHSCSRTYPVSKLKFISSPSTERRRLSSNA